MKKKKIILTIIAALFLIIFVSCSDINPFFAGGVVPGGNWIYFSEGSSIKKMRLDGSELKNVFDTGYGDIARLQLDPLGRKIYILEQTANSINKIYEYNLDGTQQKLIVDKGIKDISDMKIDSINGYLYFVSSDGIQKIDTSTQAVADVYMYPFTSSVYLAPNLNGSVYYIDSSNSSLYRADGSSTSTLITVTPALGAPGGVAINRESQYLYVYDGQMILKINLSNSTSVTILNNASIFHDKNMEVSTIEAKLFFYQPTFQYALYSINLDGSGLKKLFEPNSPLGGFDILSK